VSDEHTPTSGSRWEPTADPAAPAPHDQPHPDDQPHPHDEPTQELPTAADEPARPAPAGRRGGRAALAAAGLGLVLAGGLGGFAVGHATAGTSTATSQVSDDQVSDDGGVAGDADGDGFAGPRGGGRGLPPDFDDGQLQGTPPDATAPDETPDDSGSSSATDDGDTA
jgi:hypothetical protein